jgi:hypothetical protein
MKQCGVFRSILDGTKWNTWNAFGTLFLGVFEFKEQQPQRLEPREYMKDRGR